MWGRATGLSCQFVEFKSRTTKNQIMESLSKLKSAEERFRRLSITHDMTLGERIQCKQIVSDAKDKEREEGQGEWIYRVSSLGNENHKVKKTTLNTFALRKDENIQVVYTNADSLPNKINELKLVLNSQDNKSSVIAIT